MAEGTKVVIHLKESCSEFADYNTVREIIKKYSSFVGSDLSLDGNKANDLKPGTVSFIFYIPLKVCLKNVVIIKIDTPPAHFHPSLAGLAVLFSKQLPNGSHDFFQTFSIFLRLFH